MATERRLIDAEDAKKALLGWCTDPTDDDIEYTIDNLPTVDAVEVVHGRWLKAECSEKNGNSNCSNCGHWDWDECNFCSNCGADMRDGGKANAP